ncbi:golgin subfamily A member 6-like protein 2 [Haliotis cracherodii]|uniref:golgin subfamily A member 6-like protein 2 n=1 Tax=Haliotis cracherodii TaxID=6455 RepID=UPI0039EA2FA7
MSDNSVVVDPDKVVTDGELAAVIVVSILIFILLVIQIALLIYIFCRKKRCPCSRKKSGSGTKPYYENRYGEIRLKYATGKHKSSKKPDEVSLIREEITHCQDSQPTVRKNEDQHSKKAQPPPTHEDLGEKQEEEDKDVGEDVSDPDKEGKKKDDESDPPVIAEPPVVENEDDHKKEAQLFAKHEDLGDKQEDLGDKQEDLGGKQEEENKDAGEDELDPDDEGKKKDDESDPPVIAEPPVVENEDDHKKEAQLFAKHEDLDDKQEGLGDKQEDLGDKQEDLGDKQEEENKDAGEDELDPDDEGKKKDDESDPPVIAEPPVVEKEGEHTKEPPLLKHQDLGDKQKDLSDKQEDLSDKQKEEDKDVGEDELTPDDKGKKKDDESDPSVIVKLAAFEEEGEEEEDTPEGSTSRSSVTSSVTSLQSHVHVTLPGQPGGEDVPVVLRSLRRGTFRPPISEYSKGLPSDLPRFSLPPKGIIDAWIDPPQEVRNESKTHDKLWTLEDLQGDEDQGYSDARKQKGSGQDLNGSETTGSYETEEGSSDDVKNGMGLNGRPGVYPAIGLTGANGLVGGTGRGTDGGTGGRTSRRTDGEPAGETGRGTDGRNGGKAGRGTDGRTGRGHSGPSGETDGRSGGKAGRGTDGGPDRETGRGTDGRTGGKAGRGTDGRNGRGTSGPAGETDGRTGGKAGRGTDGGPAGEAGRGTDGRTGGKAGRGTDGGPAGQTGRGTDGGMGGGSGAGTGHQVKGENGDKGKGNKKNRNTNAKDPTSQGEGKDVNENRGNDKHRRGPNNGRQMTSGKESIIPLGKEKDSWSGKGDGIKKPNDKAKRTLNEDEEKFGVGFPIGAGQRQGVNDGDSGFGRGESSTDGSLKGRRVEGGYIIDDDDNVSYVGEDGKQYWPDGKGRYRGMDQWYDTDDSTAADMNLEDLEFDDRNQIIKPGGFESSLLPNSTALPRHPNTKIAFENETHKDGPSRTRPGKRVGPRDKDIRNTKVGSVPKGAKNDSDHKRNTKGVLPGTQSEMDNSNAGSSRGKSQKGSGGVMTNSDVGKKASSSGGMSRAEGHLSGEDESSDSCYGYRTLGRPPIKDDQTGKTRWDMNTIATFDSDRDKLNSRGVRLGRGLPADAIVEDEGEDTDEEVEYYKSGSLRVKRYKKKGRREMGEPKEQYQNEEDIVGSRETRTLRIRLRRGTGHDEQEVPEEVVPGGQTEGARKRRRRRRGRRNKDKQVRGAKVGYQWDAYLQYYGDDMYSLLKMIFMESDDDYR